MTPNTDVAGQTAVVTGGNGGIGLAIADALLRNGARVAIWARNEEKSTLALKQLGRNTPAGEVLAVTCDVTQPDDIAAALQRTSDAYGGVDICVANAGATGTTPFLDLSLQEWRATTAVTLDGAFLSFQATAQMMVEQGTGGALVAVSSTAAMHGSPHQTHYAASKAGVLALVRSAAVALAKHDIRVNALVPGWTHTDMTAAGSGTRLMEATTARTPVRRWATPDEFGPIATYLCNKRCTFHTGDSVVVDGGYTVF